MKLDDALIQLGPYGRYQVLVYLAISIFDNFISIWHMSVMAFLGYENRHHCKVGPTSLNVNCAFLGNDDNLWIKGPI